MNTRCFVFAAAAALSSLVVGCANDDHIPIPQTSQTFGSAEEFVPVADPIPALPDGASYTVLTDENGASIYSMWRLGYQSSFEVRYCKPPVSNAGEWYCRGWETWKLEGYETSALDRPARISASTTVDGADQFITMQIEDAGEQWSHKRDCYVMAGIVDFGQCSDWTLVRHGGI